MIEDVPQLDAAAYRELSRDVRASLGIDLESYKPHQVWRRVNGFARRRGFDGAAAMARALDGDIALRAALRDLLTINVSEFFRDGAAWDELGAAHLRPMLTSGRVVRAWSAGSSFGFEPYSLAMLASELVPNPPIRILATDVDEIALARTRDGRFSAAEVEQLEAGRRDRHLVVDGDGWLVRPELARLVEVRRHDLTIDAISGTFDLIVCRNVLIYFTDATKARLYDAFARALRPAGILFVGGTEIVPNPGDVGLRLIGRCLYERM